MSVTSSQASADETPRATEVAEVDLSRDSSTNHDVAENPAPVNEDHELPSDPRKQKKTKKKKGDVAQNKLHAKQIRAAEKWLQNQQQLNDGIVSAKYSAVEIQKTKIPVYDPNGSQMASRSPSPETASGPTAAQQRMRALDPSKQTVNIKYGLVHESPNGEETLINGPRIFSKLFVAGEGQNGKDSDSGGQSVRCGCMPSMSGWGSRRK
mmetsp:Transcript_1466/g.2989  ORF Transcript_1466/g.2989 Transcript_1466/m.2989 type:complete len:209 (+) Transcript_1466:111-737(+)